MAVDQRVQHSAETFSKEEPTLKTTATSKTADEPYTLVGPRKTAKKIVPVDDDEPLIDTTEAIPLKSKKIERMQKKQRKKLKKTTVQSDTKSFLELPHELLQEVLSYLQPSDIFRLLRLNKSAYAFIQENEASIVRNIMRRRYWVLSRSFHLPVPLSELDPVVQASLLNKSRQDGLQLNRKYFQHVKPLEPEQVCSCMTCLLSWNNLCVILDLAHFWQNNLSKSEPIPIILRGTYPEWNRKLTEANAAIVEKALQSPLHYAMILQIHLSTIVGTITRQFKVGKKTYQPKRLFRISHEDVLAETDEFMERSGPPSWEFPYHRDIYYSLEAYVPNRKWDKEGLRWQYANYPRQQHDADVGWIMKRFRPDPASKDELDSFVAAFAQQVRT